MPTEETKPKTAKDIVKEYLDNRAATDGLFAKAYAKPAKDINECWQYILGEAKKRGSAVCMTGEEVFGLAVHYYDEDDIKVNMNIGAHRVSTSSTEAKPKARLTEKEKAAAKEEAKRLYQEQCIAELEKASAKKKKSKAAPAEVQQTPSLFDFDF